MTKEFYKMMINSSYGSFSRNNYIYDATRIKKVAIEDYINEISFHSIEKGITYEVSPFTSDNLIYVYFNNGFIGRYPENKFTTIENWRQIQLNELDI